MLFLSLLFLTRCLHLVSSLSFPDCVNGPLAQNDICNPLKSVNERVKALIEQFSVAELINNTVNGSPGVPRLGLPAYQWWSEGLVSILSYPILLSRYSFDSMALPRALVSVLLHPETTALLRPSRNLS